MLKNIYEHLKTRKKYNTLLLNYEMLEEKYDKKVIELNQQKRINKLEQEKYEEAIEELMQKLAKEKEKNNKRRKKDEK